MLYCMQKRQYECCQEVGTAGYKLSAHLGRRHHAWGDRWLDLQKPKDYMVIIADRLVRYMCYFGAGETIVRLGTAVVVTLLFFVCCLEKHECERVCYLKMGVYVSRSSMSDEEIYELFNQTYDNVSSQLLLLLIKGAD